MKKILLWSGKKESELEFARMLELELAERNFAFSSEELTEDCSAVVLVFDLCEAAVAESLGRQAEELDIPVICCARELSESVPSGIVYFERPFDVKRFCDYMVLVTGSGQKEARRQRGNFGDGIVLNPVDKSVTCRGEKIELTNREFELLRYLNLKRGQPVSREEAIREVWEFGYTGDTNVVDVYIRYLRRKLDERFDTRYIVTVRGKGYMLR